MSGEGSEKRDSLKQRAFGAAVWKTTERFGAAAISIVVQIVLARLLTPADFGLIAVVVVFTNIATVFVQSGLNIALVREAEISPEDTSTVFWFSLAIASVLYIALFASSSAVARFYAMPLLESVLRVLGLVLFVNAYNCVQVALLQRSLRMRSQFVATLVAAVVSGSAGIGLACCGLGVWALVAQTLLMQIVSCAVMALQVRWRPYLMFKWESLKRLFGFGWKLLASSLLHTIYTSAYDLVVGKVFSGVSLGYFSQGKKYPEYAESIMDTAISSVTLPTASLVKDSPAELKALMKRGIQIATTLIFPGMLALMVSSRSIVVIVLGSQWVPSVPFFSIFCLASMFSPITRVNLQCFNAIGRSDVYLTLEIVKKVIAISMIVAAAMTNNLMILASVSILYSVVAVLINMTPSQRFFGYGCIEQMRDFAWPLITSLFAAAIAYLPLLLIHNDWVLIWLQPLILVASYAVMNEIVGCEGYRYTVALFREVVSRAVAGLKGRLRG